MHVVKVWLAETHASYGVLADASTLKALIGSIIFLFAFKLLMTMLFYIDIDHWFCVEVF